MSDNKAVMQMALEALGLYLMAGHGNSTDFTKQGVAYDKAIEGIAALSDAIAQPEQTAPSSALKKLLFKIDGLAGSGMIPWQIEDAYADYAESIAQPKAKT